MPSNTALPAAELLRLADAMANTHTASPDFFEARDAYLAARAASPRTLEEVLMIKEYEEQERFNSLPPDDRYHKYEPAANAIQARYEHARRLAGEGGA